MIHLGLFFLIIITFELLQLFKFKFLVRKNIFLYKKLFRLFKLKKASDIYKEKAPLNYSKNLFIVSIKIILILSSVLILFVIFSFLNKSFLDLIFSLFGILETIILFLTYMYLKKYFNAKL